MKALRSQCMIAAATFVLAAVAYFVFDCHQDLAAAPPSGIESKIIRVDVPADRADVWFRETKNLVAIQRAEFEQLLKGCEVEQAGPRPALVTSARYTATLAGEALREGHAKLNIQRVGDKPTLLPLGQFNLAVRDLAWSDRPAIWGSDETGQTWLMADVDQGEVLMNWNAAGRSVAGELNFNLQFPTAAMSSLDLRVPKALNVKSTPEARPIEEGSDDKWQVWRIQLGNERRCRIATSNAKPTSPKIPVILYEQELGAIVREQDLRFQTVFQAEVFDAPVTELTFNVPASVDVYAVTYGQDVPLTWSRAGKTDAAGTLTVRLPGSLLGRSRPIRIDGVAQKPNASMISPQISVKDGIFVGGRHTLTIVAPLQLRSFRPTGFRQQTPATNTPEGESYTFQQMLADAQLILEVGRPQAALTAQVHSLFEMNDSAWTLTSELTWIASSGGVFQTECQFPADWEITDVRLPSELGTARLAGWDVNPQSGGQTLLTIEFLEALAPTVPRTIRVLARRRPLITGSSFPLPLPHPANCYSVESTLGLVLPLTISPFVSEDSRLERISPPDDPSAWAIRPRRLAANQGEYWYRREAVDSGGTLQLSSRLRRVAASSETTIVATAAEYAESYRIACQAEGTPIDRLLVYLTQPGTEVRWSMVTPRQGELLAQRLPTSQHADWNLPTSGELWELRLPPLSIGTIKIEGHRGTRWLPQARPALLVVPQSTDRRSQVTLRHPGSLDLQVESNLLDNAQPKANTPEQVEAEPDPASAVSVIERTRIWTFDNPSAELVLSMRNPERSSEFPTMVSMRLRSLLSANQQGYDLYRAQIRLENGTSRDELRIRLPSSAILQQVTVAGQTTVPNRQDNELLLSDLNAARRDVIELLYRVPSEGGEIRNVHRIVVPQISVAVLGFAWEFALPPTEKVYAEPIGVRMTKPLPKSAWTERIFGPLGRPADELFFNPFAAESWRDLTRQNNAPDKAIGDFSHELIAPAEWQVHQAISAVVPTEIRLETWQAHQTRLLAWITLIVNLMLGIVLRILGWRYRDRIAAYWLAMLVAGGLFAPSPYAEIIGGAIAGTIIALLSPRRSVITPRRDPSQVVPLGSTHSFDWGTAVCLLVALAVTSYAQDASSPSPTPSSTTAVPETVASRYTILVPVDSDGKPSKELRLVYLSQQLLSSLRQANQARIQTPKILIAAAQYQLTANTAGADSLKANFRVHLLDIAKSHQILLPIANAFLTGNDACKINGVAHPAQVAADGGFLITWNPNQSGEPTSTLDVELDLKRAGVRTALGGSFQAKSTIAAASRWTVTLPESAVFFDVAGAQGATDAADDRRSFVIDVGSASAIDVRWSQNPPEVRPQSIEVSQLQSLDLRSTHGELRFRFRCEPVDSQFDFLDIDLPPKSLIRDSEIRTTNLLRTEVIETASGPKRLRITFNEPQKQKFTIDGTMLIAAPEGITPWSVPSFGVTRSWGLKVSTTQNWWCVSSPLEYKLEHQNLESEPLQVIPAADFLQAWGESPPSLRQQFLFQPRDGSTAQFTATPQIPRRRVLAWNQVGTVSRRRLEWTLSARLETSQAPVYQHFLLIDRRLQIESISVMEGGAERRLRWSESRSSSPTRIVIFLSDKTTGVQQLTLRGSMPARYGRSMALPFIRCEEAELVESRWELYRDADVEVELTLPRGVPPFEPSEESTSDGGPRLIARYQTADPDPKTSIRISAVQARCAARTAVALTHGEGSTWKLAGQMKLAPEGDSPRRLGVHFPATYDPTRVRVDRAEANWHEPVDGRRRLDLTLQPDPGEVVITFETIVDEPAKGDWALPFPEPQEASSQVTHLLISPADAWTPLEGTELKPDESPDWAEDILRDLRPDSTATEYQLATLPIRLHRSQSPTHADHPEIRMLDHSLWITEQGNRIGISRAYLSQTREMIQFEIPEGFQPVAVFLDERPLALPTPFEKNFQIPLVGGARESVLVIYWEQRHAPASGLARIQHEELPRPLYLNVASTLVTVIPYRDAAMISRDGEKKLDWMDAALDRLEMLLARQESLGNDPRAAAANRRLILDLQAQFTARLPVGVSSPTTKIAMHLQRWNRIVTMLNQLEPYTSPRSPLIAEPRMPQVEELFVDLPQSLRVSLAPQSHIVTFWLLDRRWVNAVGALLTSLVAIPLFRRFIRLDWGEWLNRRTTVAWLMIGAIWWMFLTPGPVGPLIMVIAILRSGVQRQQSKHSVMIVDN